MGLDVYTYYCKDRPKAKAIEERYEKDTEGFWDEFCDAGGKWKEMSKEEQDARYKRYEAAKAKVAKGLGLNEDGGYPGVEQINSPSAKYPEHYFKVGYFRSSYNGSGINNVLHRYGLEDLYYIMGAGDEYEFTPDWRASRDRAGEVLTKFRTIAHGDVDLFTVSANPFCPDRGPKSMNEARRMVLEVLEQKRGSDDADAFSNGYGEFRLKGLEVIAMLPGSEDSFTKKLYGQAMPCTYIAYRKKGENDWYKQALEIVIETCDFVLATKDPQNYYLHWSS